jgi:hypothetical protein
MPPSAKESLQIAGIELRLSEVDEFIAVENDGVLVARGRVGQTDFSECRKATQLECRGTFRGKNAKLRSESLDAVRMSVNCVPLYFGNYAAQVCIIQFEADYGRPDEIPYRLRCVVQGGASNPADTAAFEAFASTSRTLKALAALVRALARRAAQDPSPESSDPEKEDKP